LLTIYLQGAAYQFDALAHARKPDLLAAWMERLPRISTLSLSSNVLGRTLRARPRFDPSP
ncbi:MAG: hypothetical protein M3Q54_03680, partial [Actinomycetota bacterium]|nr:hypothetical protein [Actinomycetota bacterium]